MLTKYRIDGKTGEKTEVEQGKSYVVMNETADRIENNFTYHAPTADQIERYQKVRDAAKTLEYLIRELTPPSREQSVSSTKLEEAVFWSNAAIARNE